MGWYLFGFVCGYLVCRFKTQIWKYITDKFDNDGGGPPAFV